MKKELTRQKELSWEVIHILLSFLETCIKNDKLSDEFLKEFFSSFTILANKKEWEIREKCASLLRVLRAHNSSEIQLIYEQSHSEALKNEREDKVQIILRLPPHKKHVESNKPSSLSNLRSLNDHIIGREDEIKEIERRLNEKNRMTICGFGGTGKSMLAVQYCKQFSNKFDIVWDIDSKVN